MRAVFAGGFHADLGAAVVEQPHFQRFEVRIEGGEPLNLVSGNTPVVCEGDGGDYKFFVYIHATADNAHLFVLEKTADTC